MALFQNNYGAAQTDAYGNVPSTDEYGNAIHRDEYGNIMAGTDEYGKVIRTDESGYAIPTDDYGNPIRHSGSTFQGMQRQQQQRQRHDLSTEYDGQGRGRRNMAGEAAHRTDAYGNVIRTDEYGNVIPTDEYGNRISISGVGHKDHRSDTSYATATTYPTTAGYGTGEQPQHRHHQGVMEKIKDKLSGTSYDQHDEYY